MGANLRVQKGKAARRARARRVADLPRAPASVQGAPKAAKTDGGDTNGRCAAAAAGAGAAENAHQGVPQGEAAAGLTLPVTLTLPLALTLTLTMTLTVTRTRYLAPNPSLTR